MAVRRQVVDSYDAAGIQTQGDYQAWVQRVCAEKGLTPKAVKWIIVNRSFALLRGADDRIQTSVRLRPEVHKRLRFLAVEREMKMIDLIAEAVDKYLAEQ